MKKVLTGLFIVAISVCVLGVSTSDASTHIFTGYYSLYLDGVQLVG